MTMISDMDLARLWLRQWRPEPGEYMAPAARVTWDGTALICEAGSAELDRAAALLCPGLAADLARLQRRAAAVTLEPSIAALEAGYGPATAQLGSVVVHEGVFREHLTICRGCAMWNETARDGRGRCDSVRCRCSHPLLWLGGKACPEGKWPA